MPWVRARAASSWLRPSITATTPDRRRVAAPLRNDTIMATHSAPMMRAKSKLFDDWLRSRTEAVRVPLAAAVGIGAFGGLAVR